MADIEQYAAAGIKRAATMDTHWLWHLLTILSYLILPFRLLLSGLLYLLSWLFAPLFLLGCMGKQISTVSLRLLAQFEVRADSAQKLIWRKVFTLYSQWLQTFYIFFGVAIGVGIVFGLALHLLERYSVQLLRLDRLAPPKERPVKGHSASSYRAAREQKRMDEELRKAARSRLQASEPLLGRNRRGRDVRRRQMKPLSPTRPRPRAGLLSTTILEEVDDSEDDYE